MRYWLCHLRKHRVHRKSVGGRLFWLNECYTCARRWKLYQGMWIFPSSMIGHDVELITWPEWTGPEPKPPLWRYMHGTNPLPGNVVIDASEFGALPEGAVVVTEDESKR